MRFSTSTLVALLATPIAVLAQTTNGPNAFKLPPSGLMVTAGKPTTLQWSPTTQGTVTLILRSGASSDLEKGVPIAKSIPNDGSYTWTPASDTTRGSDYTIEIVSDSDANAVNYTPQFVLDSTNTVASSTGGTSSATASATASASSSASSASASSASASSASMSASMSSESGSSSASATGSSTQSASGSMTTSAASASGSNTSAGFMSQTSSGLAPRATAAAAGIVGGAIAFGAMVL